MTRILLFVKALRLKKVSDINNLPSRSMEGSFYVVRVIRTFINPITRRILLNGLQSTELKINDKWTSKVVFFIIGIKNKIDHKRGIFNSCVSWSGFPGNAFMQLGLRLIPFSVKQHLRQPVLRELVLYKSISPTVEKLFVKIDKSR